MTDKDSLFNLNARSLVFALEIVRIVGELPKTTTTAVLGKQLLRSGTSVGAQYREASQAKSDADFVSKLEGSLQELDETRYWLELLTAANFLSQEQFSKIDNEANQLTAIFTSIVKKTKSKF